MRYGPATINGIAGPVVVDTNIWSGRHTISVAGRSVPRVGRGTYALPAAAGGTVNAKVHGALLDAYPTLEIRGVKHRTGPATPMALRMLALLPVVGIIGGLIGALLGALGVVANMAIARTSMTSAVKALLMLGVLVLVAVVYVIVATVLQSAV